MMPEMAVCARVRAGSHVFVIGDVEEVEETIGIILSVFRELLNPLISLP